MCVGTLRFDGEIIPSISSNARWLFGVSVRRGRSKRNIDRKLFQSHTCLPAISAVSLVILSAQYPCTRESMCVCVFSSHPFWTSSSLDVPAGVTQEEGHTGFLIHLPSAVRALIFFARRIQPFLSLVDREVEFCDPFGAIPLYSREYVCVCVFFPSILDIKFVGRTSRGHTGGRSHRIFNPPSFCGACLDFFREKDSAIPFPRRP